MSVRLWGRIGALVLVLPSLVVPMRAAEQPPAAPAPPAQPAQPGAAKPAAPAQPGAAKPAPAPEQKPAAPAAPAQPAQPGAAKPAPAPEQKPAAPAPAAPAAGAQAAPGQGAPPQPMPVPEFHFISRADVDEAWKAVGDLRKAGNLEAVQALTAFAARFPDTDYARQALYGVGQAFQAQRLWPEAVVAFNNFISRYPGHDFHDDALLQIASIFQAQEDYEGAAAANLEFQRQLPRHASADRCLYMAGVMYQRAEDPASAMSAFEALVAAYPNSDYCDEALYAMAQIHVTDATDKVKDLGSVPMYRDFAPAIRLYETIVNNLPYSDNYDNAAYQVAYLYYAARQYQKAMNALEDFIAAYPGSDLISSARTYINVCLRSLRQLPRYDTKEKLPTIRDALKPVERLRGLKQWAQAVTVCQAVIRDFPANDQRDNIMVQIGDIFEEGQDIASAVKAWRAVVDGCPGSDQRAACMWKIVTALKKAKDTTGTLQAELEYVRLFPSGPYAQQAWTDILTYYRTERDLTNLLAALKRIYTEFTHIDLRDDALFEAAGIYQQLRRYADAAALYTQLIRSYPGSDLATDSLFLLGRCQHEAGDLKKAVESYRLVIATMPNTGLADDAINELRALERPEEHARLRLYREASLPSAPPATTAPEKWEKIPAADGLATEPLLGPLLDGIGGPTAAVPCAHTPVHLLFKMERQLPIALEIKWLAADQSFMNLQVFYNGELMQKVTAKKDTVTQVTIPPTRSKVGQNVLSLTSLDNGLRWDYIGIVSQGLPAERQGHILIGTPDDSHKEFAAGLAASAAVAFTEAFFDLDAMQWASKPDSEYQMFRDAVAALTPAKDGQPPAKDDNTPAPTKETLYREAYWAAVGYFARRYDIQAAKLTATLLREPLPADLKLRVQGLYVMACESAREYGMEEIRRDNLVILAPPAAAVQLRQYNVPDFYQMVFDTLREGSPGPRPEDTPYVISLAANSAGAHPQLGRYSLAWRTNATQWVSLTAPMVRAWMSDPVNTGTLAQLHPGLPAAYATLAGMQVELNGARGTWNAQQRTQFESRRKTLLAATASTTKDIDPKKVPPDAMAGWILRMALSEKYATSALGDLQWARVGAFFNTLRLLPDDVLKQFAKPPERAAILAWAVQKHITPKAVPHLAHLGVKVDDKVLPTVAAALDKLGVQQTAEAK